jgi:hypothetical protein
MHELRLADSIRHFGLELERLAGEALTDVAIEGRIGFFPEHLGNSFADYLLRRKTEPLCIVPVDELIAGSRVAVGDGNMNIVGDQAQLALAIAQQILCCLRASSLSMLCHQRVDPADGCLRSTAAGALSQSALWARAAWPAERAIVLTQNRRQHQGETWWRQVPLAAP